MTLQYHPDALAMTSHGVYGAGELNTQLKVLLERERAALGLLQDIRRQIAALGEAVIDLAIEESREGE